MDWKSQQNPDGGWAWSRGCSWTEPTAFVLLAQSATGIDKQSFDGGLRFLRSAEGPDGGYRPQLAVEESTWVTAVIALLPEETVGTRRYWRAIDWLKGQTGRESSWGYKLRQRLTGNKNELPDGWPWFPGAAAWVIPTSIGILAFEKALRKKDDPDLRERVEAGRRFLLSRMCADGGWNHGSNRALGIAGESYPETTGIALTALHAAPPSDRIERAKAAALAHYRTCRTAEGKSWLQIALFAHRVSVQPATDVVCRTVMDEALMTIASAPRSPLVG